MNRDLKKISQALNNILGVEAQLRKKKKSNSINQEKEFFIQLINEIERIVTRQNILYHEFGVDNSTYDEVFFRAIDKLIMFKFGKDIARVIYFYLYEKNPTDSIKIVVNNQEVNFKLNNSEDLWNFIIELNKSLKSLDK